jgi:glyoxylase-like metal-dependent hydrolase (beta-lactamase superfamily II)
MLFSGDQLFAGSVGRTDFPYGDGAALFRSMREKIMVLRDETRVLPGHGPETTIGQERRTNPFGGSGKVADQRNWVYPFGASTRWTLRHRLPL